MAKCFYCQLIHEKVDFEKIMCIKDCKKCIDSFKLHHKYEISK